MEPESTPSGLTRDERRSLVIFSSLVSLLPGNLQGRPIPGVLGAMEAARIIQGTRRHGGDLLLLDDRDAQPLAGAAALAGQPRLRLDDQEVELAWMLCHRSALKAFDHLLLSLVGEGGFRVVCGAGSPLAEGEGRRLFARHFQRHGGDVNALGELYREINGVTQLLQQGNPLERLGQG